MFHTWKAQCWFCLKFQKWRTDWIFKKGYLGFVRTASLDTDSRNTWTMLCWITKWERRPAETEPQGHSESHELFIKNYNCSWQEVLLAKWGLVGVWNDRSVSRGDLETSRLQLQLLSWVWLGVLLVWWEIWKCWWGRDVSESRPLVPAWLHFCSLELGSLHYNFNLSSILKRTRRICFRSGMRRAGI